MDDDNTNKSPTSSRSCNDSVMSEDFETMEREPTSPLAKKYKGGMQSSFAKRAPTITDTPMKEKEKDKKEKKKKRRKSTKQSSFPSAYSPFAS